MTLLVGIVTIIASFFYSSSIFELMFFAFGGLAGSIAPAMLINIVKRRTHYLAMSSMILVGLASAILWRFFGLNTIINETIPSIIIALLFHES
jgi:Na+/pantothenate symporter